MPGPRLCRAGLAGRDAVWAPDLPPGEANLCGSGVINLSVEPDQAHSEGYDAAVLRFPGVDVQPIALGGRRHVDILERLGVD